MPLIDLINNGKVPGNILEIKIIKRHDTGYYIIGDTSGLALLSTTESPEYDKVLEVGKTLKLIKPELIEKNTIQCSKSFKPMPSKKILMIEPTEDDISRLEIKIKKKEIKQEKSEKPQTFESILQNKSQTIIPCLTVLVTNVSRMIETKRGKYQIVGLIDIESQSLSLNLYDSHIGKMEGGNIYKLTKLKKTTIKKEGETETRLSTTKFTNISDASEKEQEFFKNVKLAANQWNGIILGVSEINHYKSCPEHWNKLDEDEFCPKCDEIPSEVKLDFNSQLYIQDSDTDDIKPFLIFKRQMKTITDEDNEDEIDKKMEELEGKECKIDFDDPVDDNEIIIPKRLIVN